MLKKNIDDQGRILRFIIGLSLLIIAIFYHSWIALGLAIFTFFEAYMSWCVIYQLLGKNSCPK